MKYLNYIPYGCLLSYLALLFVRQPQIADSFIVLGLLGLVGYVKYLSSKEQPDYLEIFSKEFHKLQKEVEEAKGIAGQFAVKDKMRQQNEQFKF